MPRSGKNIWKMNFFQVREKSGNFVDGYGNLNLERTWKAREKSCNLKINGYGRQSPENLFILFKRGKYVLSREIVQAHLLFIWCYSERKEFVPLGSKFFPLRVAPKFEVII